MKEFLQALQDAFPVLKNHPVALAGILLGLVAISAIYAAKGWRKKFFGLLCSKLYNKIALRQRWVYVYHSSALVNDWKYYTSEVTGQGNTGDDVIWTLVRW